ncbi:MAG: heptosyltransferase I [Gammaproteobacteria bacterium]|jgi:heptosyltransferase I
MIEFQQTPDSVCLFRLSAIGDVSHILPLIHRLKKYWPNTKITWIIGKLEYHLVKSLTGVEFIVFDKSLGWKSYPDLLKKLRGRKFDVLLMMQAALRASIASLLIKAPIRVGFDRSRAIDAQWLFSNRKIEGQSQCHVLEGFSQFLDLINVPRTEHCWDIPIAVENIRYADALIEKKPAIIINPCSSARQNNWRNWNIKDYAAIGDHLVKHGYLVFLTGGPSASELEFCSGIQQAAQSSFTNLSGKTTLGQLLALIKKSRLLIAPDTGPAHMATMVDTPVIGLYASSNPLRTGPYRSLEIAINRYPEALLQYSQKTTEDAAWGERVRHPDVMNLIRLDEVINKIDQVLKLI